VRFWLSCRCRIPLMLLVGGTCNLGWTGHFGLTDGLGLRDLSRALFPSNRAAYGTGALAYIALDNSTPRVREALEAVTPFH